METNQDRSKAGDEDRRAFLKACGRFAAVTPPAVTMLLSTSLTSKAIASSGGGGGSISAGGGWSGGPASGSGDAGPKDTQDTKIVYDTGPHASLDTGSAGTDPGKHDTYDKKKLTGH